MVQGASMTSFLFSQSVTLDPAVTCKMASFSAAPQASQRNQTHRRGFTRFSFAIMVLLRGTVSVFGGVRSVEAIRIARNLHVDRNNARSRASLPTTCAAATQRRIQLHSIKKEDDADDFRQKQFRQPYPVGMASSNPSRAPNKSTYPIHERQYQVYPPPNDSTSDQNTFITREMERNVEASARASIDSNTVSRAISSLVDDKSQRKNDNKSGNPGYKAENKDKNTLRYLAGKIRSSSLDPPITQNQDDFRNNSWDTQQIAIASGATTFLLSPIIIPIVHSLIPPLFPFPSSISFEGAALLGALAYILALGDPTDQSNIISKTAPGGILGDGVEVTGAVSRIVGRTALQSVQTSAPRLKAVARAVVDYDGTVNTVEEMKQIHYQLSRRLSELESENENLRREIALWNAVEDISSVFKLEELKEMARVKGLRGYSTDGKTALLRRLVKEGVLELDLSPYYRNRDVVEERLDSA